MITALDDCTTINQIQNSVVFVNDLPLYDTYTPRNYSAIIMLSSEIGEARNGVGCIGEFATFGFLTFMISMVNTLINIVVTNNIINNNNNNNNNDNNNNNNNNNNMNMNMNTGGKNFQGDFLPFMDMLEGFNEQLQMVDRVIRRVYPTCHQSYQCHYASKMLDYLPDFE